MKRLKWHGMVCPVCKQDDQLDVMFHGMARLTPDGSEDISDHEWDGDSRCVCNGCGFKGPARAFQWYPDARGDLDLLPDDAVTFEIQMVGMIADPNDPGAFINVEAVDGARWREPDFFDVYVRRLVERTGVIDIIEEHENLNFGHAQVIRDELEEKYPFADAEFS